MEEYSTRIIYRVTSSTICTHSIDLLILYSWLRNSLGKRYPVHSPLRLSDFKTFFQTATFAPQHTHTDTRSLLYNIVYVYRAAYYAFLLSLCWRYVHFTLSRGQYKVPLDSLSLYIYVSLATCQWTMNDTLTYREYINKRFSFEKSPQPYQ